MGYKIDSDKLDNPLLIALLENLNPIFEKMDLSYYVIGATARDIVMELYDESSGRRTMDVDIALTIDDWEQYELLEQKIENLDDFSVDHHQKQRFTYKGNFHIDIVPFGKINSVEGQIFWPPDENFAMSILGFEEATQKLIKVNIDDRLEIEVASLESIFLLKIFAWNDRHQQGNKDADDLGFILQNYLSINEERAATQYYDVVYALEDYSLFKGAAVLLGIDLDDLLGADSQTKKRLKEIIESELQAEEESVLLNQMIETNHFNFNELQVCFELFNQRIH